MKNMLSIFNSDKLNKLLSDKRFWFCTLVLITAFSRFILIAGNYSIFSWDAGNFALAVDSFSLEEGRPHLPGYYVHVQLIRMLTSLTGDKFVSMNLFSVLYSALAAGFIFLIATRWFSILDSVLFTLLVITNPLAWFYGSVAEIYAFDLFASALLVWMGFSPYALVVTPSLMGLILGVRPSTGILLLTLYIYFWQKHFREKSISLKATLFFHAPAVIIVLTWLAPLMILSGGVEAYLHLYKTNNPVENITVLQSIFRFSSYLITVVPIVLIFIVAEVIKRNRAQELIDILDDKSFKKDRYFLSWWLWPPLIFFIFVHYSKGYILICLVPILLFGVFFFKNIRLRKIVLAVTILFQITYFLFIPYQYPNPEIYMPPGKRQINLPGIWYERTNAEYQMSRSHIVALQECYDFIAEMAESVEMIVGDKKYLFFDPTVIISPRAMQASYPEIKITKYLSSSLDQYGYHHERIQEARTGLTLMLGESFIISRLDFVEEYLTDIQVEFYNKNDNWVIFFVPAEESKKLSARYNQLFSRYH